MPLATPKMNYTVNSFHAWQSCEERAGIRTSSRYLYHIHFIMTLIPFLSCWWSSFHQTMHEAFWINTSLTQGGYLVECYPQNTLVVAERYQSAGVSWITRVPLIKPEQSYARVLDVCWTPYSAFNWYSVVM